MDTALAKLLTTALVQFVDKNQPKDKMDVSSIEAEELERCFTEEKFNRVEDWYAHRMKPELTEFEKCMLDFAKARDEYEFDSTKVVELNDKVIELTKSYAKTLLTLAKKELCSLCDEHLKGFSEGYDKANKDKSYHFPTMPTPPSGWGCDGTHCTNPQMDCINCPRKTTGGMFTTPNTASGTSTLKADG